MRAEAATIDARRAEHEAAEAELADDTEAAGSDGTEGRERMSYRERRLAKAERLRGWADGRERKAASAHDQSDAAVAGIPLGQPVMVGHHSQRGHERALERSRASMTAAVEHDEKAREMRDRATNIEASASQAIYSDDEDAEERLTEKIAGLEAKRDRIKAENATFRKEHREQLKTMTAYQRDRALPHPSYELTNLSGNISRLRKRQANLPAERADRLISARRSGRCEDCGAPITPGDTIRYSRTTGARCETCA